MEFISGLFGSVENVFSFILPFLFVLTVIVFFHELGHFMMARWCGVAVETFSVGFGREIFGFTDKKGTRWKFSWIPLGGYVKFLGDENAASVPARDALDEMDEEARKTSFYHKPLAQRSAVVAAGPIANFILAIVIFTMIFLVYGRTVTAPIVDDIAVGSAAEKAGFEIKDKVVSIDGQEIETFGDMQGIVRVSAEKTLSIVVQRGDDLVTLTAVPKLDEISDVAGNKHKVGVLGITRNTQGDLTVERYGPLEAVWMGTQQTWLVAKGTLGYVGGLLVGNENVDQLGGPARIAHMSKQFFDIGLGAFFHLAAALSVSIGLINLFPIPMLDGGHLMYYGIEAVRGKPLSEKMQDLGFRVGLGLVVALMVFVTWLDLSYFNFFGG